MSPLAALRLSTLLFVLATASGQAAHPFLCCDYLGDKVCVVSAEGAIQWEYAAKNPQDCWLLPNGHYLVCFKGEGTIVELDGEGKVLRSIKVPGDPHEVVPLADQVLDVPGDVTKGAIQR